MKWEAGTSDGPSSGLGQLPTPFHFICLTPFQVSRKISLLFVKVVDFRDGKRDITGDDGGYKVFLT